MPSFSICLLCSDDTNVLLVGGVGFISRVCLKTLRVLKTAEKGEVVSMAWMSDKRGVFVAEYKQIAMMFVHDLQYFHFLETTNNFCMATDLKRNILITGNNKLLKVWSTRNLSKMRELELEARRISLSPDRQHIYTAGLSKIDIDTWQISPFLPWKQSFDQILVCREHVLLSRKNELLIVSFTGKIISRHQTPSVFSMVALKRLCLVICATRDGTVFLFDSRKHSCSQQLKLYENWIWDVRLRSRNVITASYDESINVVPFGALTRRAGKRVALLRTRVITIRRK